MCPGWNCAGGGIWRGENMEFCNLDTSGQMAFKLQNGFGGFISAAAHAAEQPLSGLGPSYCTAISSQTNLAILSIKRQTVEQIEFTKVIENFAAERARKVLI